MTYAVNVNYGPEYDAPRFEYSEVILVEWCNENWLRFVFEEFVISLSELRCEVEVNMLEIFLCH
jgi:hypothetical protein